VDFRTTDQAGNQTSDSRSFKIDQTRPHLSFRPTGTQGENDWYISEVGLGINSSDAESGIEPSEYQVNGSAWSTGASLLLSEGVQQVQAQVSDQAGNISTDSLTLKIDTTAPAQTISLSGTSGKNNWYISNVTASASVSDATSGIALTEYSLDGGSWQSGTSVIASSDGAHTVDFLTTDKAGNRTTGTKSFKIDQTSPISAFLSPLEGSTGTLAQGLFSLDGHSTDATSGLAAVQISMDEGLTWLELPITPTGRAAWQYVWDTKPLSNGLYPVLARAQEPAGNIETTARVTLLLANHPPKVSIQESWWIWEGGSLAVGKRFIPISEIRVRIGCLDGQPDVKLTFTAESLPTELQWDHKCGQGQFATIGDHPVTLTACDQCGNCASAEGKIKVPFIAPPVPTWTPTVEPSPTSVSTAVARPSPTAQATPLPTIVPSPPPPAPVAQRSEPAWLTWSLAILLAGLLALAAAAVLDPRPRALRRLGKSLAKVASSLKD